MSSSHIVIFLPSLAGGGAERVMVTLANAFAEIGHRVDLVLANKKGPYLHEVSPLVNVVDLGAGRVIKALLPLARYLMRENPDAMLSAMGHANVVAIIAKMISRSKLRLVISERTTISVAYQKSIGLVSKINFMLIKTLYPRADVLCSVSQAAANDLAKFLMVDVSRVKIIYNPFDFPYIAKRASEAINHPWFLPDSPPVVLAVGRLTEAKDYPTLIRAISLLRQMRKVRLLILGEGELRDKLIAFAQECGLTGDDVQFHGFQENPYAYMARANLFVLSSRWEGLPGALIQAMACGAPVISTDCLSGPSEILEYGRWGKLVPVGDVSLLAQAMAEVLDTPRNEIPDVRSRLQFFTKDRAAKAYLELLLDRAV